MAGLTKHLSYPNMHQRCTTIPDPTVFSRLRHFSSPSPNIAVYYSLATAIPFFTPERAPFDRQLSTEQAVGPKHKLMLAFVLPVLALVPVHALADAPTSGVGGSNMNGEYRAMVGTSMITMKPYAEQGYAKAEWFDVYSPEIKTLYGQVFWTMMEGTPLPPRIVRRFKNKTMAVVGYECNQIGQMANGSEYAIPINAERRSSLSLFFEGGGGGGGGRRAPREHADVGTLCRC